MFSEIETVSIVYDVLGVDSSLLTNRRKVSFFDVKE